MQTIHKKPILGKDDYQMLVSYVKDGYTSKFDSSNAEDLQTELERADLVEATDLPADVVRVNSKVKVKVEGKTEIMELTVVMPEQANLREGKISVFAPIGTALLGFSKGQVIRWTVPSGKKKFTIIEVIN